VTPEKTILDYDNLVCQVGERKEVSDAVGNANRLVEINEDGSEDESKNNEFLDDVQAIERM
jgi:hypothetical protein